MILYDVLYENNGFMMNIFIGICIGIGIGIQGVTAISGKRFKLIFFKFILLVLKQTISQQKALDFSFNLTP